MRRRVAVGRRARARVQAGGKLAVGRQSLPRAAWRLLVASLTVRCRGRCERPGCGRRGADAHHIVKRSQGGVDHPDNVVILCRPCHELTDAPYSAGRFVVDPLPGELFIFCREWRRDKWSVLLREEIFGVYQRPRG